MIFLNHQKKILAFCFLSLSSLLVFFKENPKTQNPLKQTKPHAIKGLTMGTYYVVKYFEHENSSISAKKVHQLIENDLAEINRQMSTYIEDSEISKFNRYKAHSDFLISPWFETVISYSLELAKKTKGYFDPTVGPLVNIWGFGPKKTSSSPSTQEIKDTLELVGFDKLHLKKNKLIKDHSQLYLDLSSVAKGFAVDKISDHLSSLGFTNHLVEIGGEIKARGYKNENSPWLIGIEKPQMERALEKLIRLENKAIATSGDYRNFLTTQNGLMAHTINPKTGEATVTDLVSVSILSKTCMEADATATALLVMGEQKAKTFVFKHNLAAMFIIKTSPTRLQTWMSENFKKWTLDQGDV